MCGRFTRFKSWDEIHAALRDFLDQGQHGWKQSEEELKPRYNQAPQQMAPIVVRDDGNDVAGVMARWDFVPFFFKQPLEEKTWTSINAKVEEIATKPAYRGAIKSKRCLIPNNGFYEWKTENGKKQPYWFQPTDSEVAFFGGVWDFWEGTHKGQPAGFISFAILTCAPNSLVRDVHNRMPVVIRPEDYEAWMYAERDEALKIADQPYPAQMMRVTKVDPAVGNVKNDYPTLLQTA